MQQPTTTTTTTIYIANDHGSNIGLLCIGGTFARPCLVASECHGPEHTHSVGLDGWIGINVGSSGSFALYVTDFSSILGLVGSLGPVSATHSAQQLCRHSLSPHRTRHGAGRIGQSHAGRIPDSFQTVPLQRSHTGRIRGGLYRPTHTPQRASPGGPIGIPHHCLAGGRFPRGCATTHGCHEPNTRHAGTTPLRMDHYWVRRTSLCLGPTRRNPRQQLPTIRRPGQSH